MENCSTRTAQSRNYFYSIQKFYSVPELLNQSRNFTQSSTSYSSHCQGVLSKPKHMCIWKQNPYLKVILIPDRYATEKLPKIISMEYVMQNPYLTVIFRKDGYLPVNYKFFVTRGACSGLRASGGPSASMLIHTAKK